jgi:hypothetical protein
MITADIMIVQTSPKISTGLVISSYTYVTEGANVVLLTDVSDILKKQTPDQLRLEQTGQAPPDELDSLDNGAGLKDNEKRELKQLENWKGPGAVPSGEPEPPVPTPTATPAATPTPAATEELPAPPTTEAVPPTAPAPAPEATATSTSHKPEESKENLEVPPPPPPSVNEPSTESMPESALPPAPPPPTE